MRTLLRIVSSIVNDKLASYGLLSVFSASASFASTSRR